MSGIYVPPFIRTAYGKLAAIFELGHRKTFVLSCYDLQNDVLHDRDTLTYTQNNPYFWMGSKVIDYVKMCAFY